MDEATKRNFTTLSEGLKEQRMINMKQTDQIKGLQATITTLQEQVGAINARYWTEKATQGIGPTGR